MKQQEQCYNTSRALLLYRKSYAFMQQKLCLYDAKAVLYRVQKHCFREVKAKLYIGQ